VNAMRNFDERKPPKVPAIVLGRGYTGLGTLRSLAMAGIPAYVACPPGDLVTRSRWYRPLPGNVSWDGEVRADIDDVLHALPFPRAVMIAARDDLALWLADLARGPHSQRFRVSSSSREALEILQDKARFGEFLARTDIPHPRTFTVQSRADIDAIPFQDLDRVFIKPADSHNFRRELGVKGIWAETRAEFEEIWARLDAQGYKVLAQEYVPGKSSDHYFIDGFRDRDGNLKAMFARRRRRIYPPDFGNSSYCESIPLAETGAAVGHLTRLLKSLEYRGIFSAEFKRDARDGEFRILEVNTRAWWYVEFAARCGMNVCRMAYEDAQEAPVAAAPGHYPVGAGCVNFYRDLKSVLAERRRGSVTVTLGQALGNWANAHHHVFRWDDPGPALSIVWERMGRAGAADGVMRAPGKSGERL